MPELRCCSQKEAPAGTHRDSSSTELSVTALLRSEGALPSLRLFQMVLQVRGRELELLTGAGQQCLPRGAQLRGDYQPQEPEISTGLAGSARRLQVWSTTSPWTWVVRGGIASTLSHSRRRRINLYLKHFSCHQPSSHTDWWRFCRAVLLPLRWPCIVLV